jgi:hypothetical protein
MTAKPPAGPVPIDGGAFADAHRDLLADNSIQFDLPMPEPAPPPPQWTGEALPLIQYVFWALLALGVAYIVYLIVQRLAGRSRSRGGTPEQESGESWRPEAGPALRLLEEADRLADQGRFGEAARLLLHRTIEEIDTRRPELVRPALTSRDIARLDDIPGRPRSAFARIAMAVERSLFAQRPLGQGDWSDCRAAYEEFAFADGWRG